MKVAIVLAAVITVALCEPYCFNREEDLMFLDIGPNMTYLLIEDEEKPGAYVVEDLVNSEEIIGTSPSDMTYYFYSKNDIDKGTKLKYDDLDPLSRTEFSPSKDTILLIHGWKNSYRSEINVVIKKSLLPKYDANVFVVDWRPIAWRNYLSAKRAVVDVGKYVASFLSSLEAKFNLNLSEVVIAGHSLGAHVSGNAGAAIHETGSVLGTILGLDPALPLFSLADKDNRLDSSDAKFVQVIHTCGGKLGFSAPIGHSDYYPNGGSSQPGCGLDIGGICSHTRAYTYYAESLEVPQMFLANAFSARECANYKAYTNGHCINNAQSNMGGYKLDLGVNGNYFLTTNSGPPFAQG